MRRASVILLTAGALLLGLFLFLSLRPGAASMPSYLADWLFWSSLPLGALPVIMLVDLAGPGAGYALEPTLRRLLLLTPVAALLMIPVLLRPAVLFGWATGHGFTTPFGQKWMTLDWFVTRSILYGMIWTILALVFAWPPAAAAIDRRRGVAAAGLFVYTLTVTLAATDWAMAVEPGWFSAEFGLLFIAAEVATAVSFAVLLAGPGWRLGAPQAAAGFVLGAVGAWMFAQFIQFLVIWSADKPTDITWYLHREDVGGIIGAWVQMIVGVAVPAVLLLSTRLRRRPFVLPLAAMMAICGQALGMLWLITPSLRHHFTVSFMDVLALAGLGGVMLGICLLFGSLSAQEAPRHA